jgi:hypothetical protein
LLGSIMKLTLVVILLNLFILSSCAQVFIQYTYYDRPGCAGVVTLSQSSKNTTCNPQCVNNPTDGTATWSYQVSCPTAVPSFTMQGYAGYIAYADNMCTNAVAHLAYRLNTCIDTTTTLSRLESIQVLTCAKSGVNITLQSASSNSQTCAAPLTPGTTTGTETCSQENGSTEYLQWFCGSGSSFLQAHMGLLVIVACTIFVL